MTDWATIASLAIAGGTLVLAVATFASVRQGNRATRISEYAARVAEQSLLAGRRPLLMNSRLQDPKQRVEFKGGEHFDVLGGRAAIRATDSVVYLAISIRNVGTGVAVLHGWYLCVGLQYERVHPPLEEFTTQNLDIYVAPGDTGYWEGACRDPGADDFKAVTAGRYRRDARGPPALRRLRGRAAGDQPVQPGPPGRQLDRVGGPAFQTWTVPTRASSARRRRARRRTSRRSAGSAPG